MEVYELGFDVLARDVFETLSADDQAEVLDFIIFLSMKQKNNTSRTVKTGSFPFDCFSGGMKYISGDFDMPLDDFREYM